MKKPLVPLVTCCALAASAMLGAGSASAAVPRADAPVTVAGGLVSPLSLEIGRRHVAYVTQDFTGTLTSIAPDGTKTDLASAPGFAIGAVSSRHGAVYYAQTAFDHSTAVLMQIPRGGTPTPLGDIQGYEQTANPDQVNNYGFEGVTPECAAQFPPPGPMTAPAAYYAGAVDTNPYASVATKDGVYVADAGANAIFLVGYDGTVSTVAVLPPQDPIEVTAERAAAQGAPACAVGTQYIAEPVPTDVELGRDGWLYVSSLPGGPEDPSLGARGSVYKVNPDTGEVVEVATGFAGATNLAVSKTGTIFVAELFGGPQGGGQVSVVEEGQSTPTPLIAVPGPAAVEIRANSLYVTTNALAEGAAGELVTIKLHRGHGSSAQMEMEVDAG